MLILLKLAACHTESRKHASKHLLQRYLIVRHNPLGSSASTHQTLGQTDARYRCSRAHVPPPPPFHQLNAEAWRKERKVVGWCVGDAWASTKQAVNAGHKQSCADAPVDGSHSGTGFVGGEKEVELDSMCWCLQLPPGSLSVSCRGNWQRLMVSFQWACRQKFPLFFSQDGTPPHPATQEVAKSYSQVRNLVKNVGMRM